jgi:L-rhamnose mutarotase
MSTFTNGVVEDVPNVNAECYTNNTRNHSTDLAQWKDYYSKYYTNEEAKINNSNKDKKDGRDKFVGCADELAKALSNVFNAFDSVNNIQTLVSPTTYGGTYKDKAIASIKNYQDFVKQANSDLFDKLVNNSIDEKTDMSKLLDNDVKKLWSRKAVHDFMKEIYADVNKEFSDSIVMANPSTLAPANFMDDLQWRTAVDSWFPEVQLSWDRDLFEHLKNTTYRSVKEWAIDDVFHPWKTIAFSAAGKHRWQTGVQGKILLSDTPGTTISFEKDGSTYKQVNAIASSKYIYDLRDFIKAL